MAYWILSLTEENYNISVEHGLIGMASNKRKSLERLSPGDQITFYIGKSHSNPEQGEVLKIQQFRGIATVTGEVFEDTSALWPPRKDDFFPWRREIQFEDTENHLYAPPIACDLSVVTNPMFWMLPFRGGHVQITQEDWNLIVEQWQK